MFLLCITVLCAELRGTWTMELVDSGPQTMMKAQGESVVLGCRYKPSPADTGDLDIEWSIVSPDTTQKDQMLVSYSGGTKYVHSENPLSKGMTFSSPDPSSSSGDASLSIPAASPAHSATYQCKVKKSPGVDTRKVSLLVLVKPSVPRCWVEGSQMEGEPVTLHCKSASGSGPFTYTWRRQSGPLGANLEQQDSVTGELKISNHSQSHAGLYLCEVNNAVGSERCQVHLRASKPPNRAAVIVGTVIGCILLILILLLFIAVLFWKLRGRHRYDKEFSNDIREDVPPPESRPVSRRTTRSSGPSQHHVTYDPLGGTELSWSDDVTSDHPSSKNQVYTPVQYDSKYGYAV
ncbi:V-set and immunoglobulin domain-containing protein 8a [Periophthalmus magnuspinnatus]|uniref:V-set and immunoglobulin domain-containing protein 8a n=1 Tax=Periophthalmus magnuspinnatus TaxID=409849 RepID=UPI0024370A38|nr:V-set and immunoglobulin domain-containing protein 8a [Periophthalmus magnuspinnatus]